VKSRRVRAPAGVGMYGDSSTQEHCDFSVSTVDA
jgi:hypothetical protein